LEETEADWRRLEGLEELEVTPCLFQCERKNFYE
jgi:hypothetical protein